LISLAAGVLDLPTISYRNVARLSLGIQVVDEVFPGLEPREFAVLHGSASNLMLFELCVRSQLPPSRGGLNSATVFVDGGNIFDPYVVAEAARRYGLNPRDALERIYVSRAFTVYQLSSLILERLEDAVRNFRSRFVAVSGIYSLFLDRDVPKTEAQELFMKVCGKLQGIAEERKVIIAASHEKKRSSSRGLFFEAVLYGRASVILGLKQSRGALRFSLERHPRIKPFSVEISGNDVCLTDFMEVKIGGEDCSIL